MQTNRRNFVAGGIASVAAFAASGRESRGNKTDDDDDDDDTADTSVCLDYGLSFLCNPSPMNSVRFWIESRTTIIDDSSGCSTVFYQCASCKSENTFGKKDLLYADNYDFMPIFGGNNAEDLLIFRRHAHLSDRYRQLTKSEKVWGLPILKLRYGKKVTLLDSWESMRDATAAGIPIVSQTEISHPDTGLRAIMECPVKTMNISLDKKMYQVDTGPIAFPDLSKKYDPQIDCLKLAFAVFNAPHFADFVIEQPTAIVENEKELCKVYHYSNPFSLAATNRVFAVDSAS